MMPRVGARRRISVFFYGLFMDDELLRAKGVQPINPRMASADGFVLLISQRATLSPDPRGRVYGIIMELTHAEIEQLYSEPRVRAYRPEAVVATLADGSQVPALCFNLPETSDKAFPNLEYATNLRELGRRVRLPSNYLENIK